MSSLPWNKKIRPLMLAPMQGLTNEALRACYIDSYEPDLVFTEFVRVQNSARKRVCRADEVEIKAHNASVPLVVQLIGNDAAALASAAQTVQKAGCSHINLNLGCPYGRMTTGATGGELLNFPDKLPLILESLRRVVSGSFSVKCRSGYRSADQIFDLLPLFENAGVDFLILHPRTVEQKYTGEADHNLTMRVVAATELPVIANGDINTAQVATELLANDALAGLMLGRGALADPELFVKIREGGIVSDSEEARRAIVGRFMNDLIPRYLEKFCGERQALMKLKDVLNFIPDPCLQRDLGKLRRFTSLDRFEAYLEKNFSC